MEHFQLAREVHLTKGKRLMVIEMFVKTDNGCVTVVVRMGEPAKPARTQEAEFHDDALSGLSDPFEAASAYVDGLVASLHYVNWWRVQDIEVTP